MKYEVDKRLSEYMETAIFPKYERLYGHGILHIQYVIDHSFLIARDYDVDFNMVYCIACYHDLGLLNIQNNREDHAFQSGKLLIEDAYLKTLFSKDQLEIMKEAVEDHSGSRSIEPRSIYGKIVSDADRDVDVRILAKRQLPTSIKYYKELVTFEEHFERCYQYILERNKKKFNLWTENEEIQRLMELFKKQFLDKDYTKAIYQEEWNYIEQNQLKEKFLTYYED